MHNFRRMINLVEGLNPDAKYLDDTVNENDTRFNITESLDSPAPWELYESGKHNKTYQFDIDANTGTKHVEVKFEGDSWPSNIWSMSFKTNHSFSMTNKGDQFKIFATVLSITKDFLLSTPCKQLQFSAVRKSRIKLR